MITIMVKIKVTNFINWKKIVDKNGPLRDEHNIKLISIYANVGDVDNIILHLEAESKEAFEEFINVHPRESKDIAEDALLQPMQVDYLKKVI